jgi:hypothetical protein
MWRIQFFCMMLLVAPATANAQDGDPVLGLRFGWTKVQVKKAVHEMDVTQQDGDFTVFITETPPLPLVDAQVYLLTFYKERLVKITVVGEDIVDDEFGDQGKRTFEKYRGALSGKYKETMLHQYSGREIHTRPDEFWQCLSQLSCGWYCAVFEGSGRSTVLELHSRYNGGYFRLDIETQEFHDGMKEHVRKTAQDAEDTL